MKTATELIHHADGVNDAARPLTTPIYETTTFLFESAEEVKDYNEGRSPKFLYSRYANPTVLAVEEKIAALEGAESALVFSSGQAATTNALMTLVGAGVAVLLADDAGDACCARPADATPSMASAHAMTSGRRGLIERR